MSHFTVLVIGNNVEEQLEPFAEFECTGEVTQYVLEVDETEEAKAEYDKDTTRRYKDQNGILHDPYENQYYRDPTREELDKHTPMGTGSGGGLSWHINDWGDGKGYRPKIHFVPDGWEDLWVPTKEVESLRDFVEGYYGRKVLVEGETPDLSKDGEHKYGWTVVNKDGEFVKTIDRTNPSEGVYSWRDAGGVEVARTIGLDKKPEGFETLTAVQVAGARWDWYQIGGRWNGFFKLKANRQGVLGDASSLAKYDKDYKAPGPGYADQALKGAIDFDAMRAQTRVDAAERYDKVYAVVGEGASWESWEKVLERFPDEVGKARDFYHAQETLQALQKSDLHFWDYDDYLCTRDEYIENEAKDACRTFAVLKDGVWYEKGRMGWWASVHDEKEIDTWRNMFFKLLDETPDDAMLTMVDCHI